jgi:hypothetical protein
MNRTQPDLELVPDAMVGFRALAHHIFALFYAASNNAALIHEHSLFLAASQATVVRSIHLFIDLDFTELFRLQC